MVIRSVNTVPVTVQQMHALVAYLSRDLLGGPRP